MVVRVLVRRGAMTALIAALAAGCATVRFDVGSGPVGSKAQERRSDWLFTLGTERVENVSEHCPNGALQITEATTALDAVSTLLTLGLWWPRTTFYDCRGEVAG